MALWYNFVFSPESRAPPYTQGDGVAPELEALTPEPVSDKKKRARPESPLEVDPDEAAKKAARRELQLLWARLKSTKDKNSNALAAFHRVDTSIRTDDAWTWATGADATRLAAAREELTETLNLGVLAPLVCHGHRIAPQRVLRLRRVEERWPLRRGDHEQDFQARSSDEGAACAAETQGRRHLSGMIHRG